MRAKSTYQGVVFCCSRDSQPEAASVVKFEALCSSSISSMGSLLDNVQLEVVGEGLSLFSPFGLDKESGRRGFLDEVRQIFWSLSFSSVKVTG